MKLPRLFFPLFTKGKGIVWFQSLFLRSLCDLNTWSCYIYWDFERVNPTVSNREYSNWKSTIHLKLCLGALEMKLPKGLILWLMKVNSKHRNCQGLKVKQDNISPWWLRYGDKRPRNINFPLHFFWNLKRQDNDMRDHIGTFVAYSHRIQEKSIQSLVPWKSLQILLEFRCISFFFRKIRCISTYSYLANLLVQRWFCNYTLLVLIMEFELQVFPRDG